MKPFAYRAFREDGGIVNGEITALTQREALQRLRAQGLIAFASEPRSPQASARFGLSRGVRRPAVTAAARLAFVHELGIRLSAQLPLDQALHLLAEQPDLKKISGIIVSITELIRAGKTLGEAIMTRPEFLREHEAAIIRAGEQSGSVAESLNQLASGLRREIELRSRLRTALTYPAVLLVMSVFTVAVIGLVLVPNLLPLFENSQSQPPAVIRLFVALRNQMPLVLGGTAVTLVAAAAGLLRLRRNEKALLIRDEIVLRLPVIGSLTKSAEAARIGRSLGLLLKSGMPVLQSISTAQRTVRNRSIRQALANAADQIACGGRIGQAFERFAVMPAAACHLAAIGEEANRLDEMMLHVAQINETAMQEKLERLMALATPVLTLLMGGLVAGLIISVMKAILGVN
ncbi:MAG: type II secretion system F family protein, partial [Aestuariivirgaceae bacterium]